MYGKCAPIIIQQLDIYSQGVVSRSIPILDFKSNHVGRMTVTFEYTDDAAQIQHRMYSLIDKINDTNFDNYQIPKPLGPNPDMKWTLIVDVRSATNLPLNANTDHGLPSTRV